ncbi:hypothetical protein AOQ84DRAFT_379910 [Glonium stellatum]|uniref:HMG box domain-containing protein n=1 Tax=Glonium stellatum TaxID=574774 RepID=A0A8E2JPV7_9PEZI|nr:hypothetical protein AOQ84DRAFT_379910 [Glonium stellatum]
MLARGLLCRLAADVPKTSTHDLSQLSRLIHRAVITHNATSIRFVRAVSHANKLSLAIPRRSYATTNKKPATTTTRAKTTVKKAAAAKGAAEKKAAPKKKTTAKKKAAPKRRVRAKASKKPLSEQALEKAAAKKTRIRLNELKKKALTEPKKRPYTAWSVYMTEISRSAAKDGRSASKITAEFGPKYQNFTPAEREHYNHLANQNRAANEAEYNAWVLKHTPLEIHEANAARLLLKRKFKLTGNKVVRIKDDRQVKAAMGPLFQFMDERRKSGDYKGIPIVEAAKLMTSEFKALSAGERKKYEDMAAADLTRYYREFESVFGRKAKGDAAASA